MAVVGYKCTVCKRTINLVQNKQGLDWIGHCNITLGCRGYLVQQEVYQDYIRGSLPDSVVGLKNWVQRQVLFDYEQTTARTNWTITHNLGVLPSVQVYTNVLNSDGTTSLQETLPAEIIYNSDNQLTIVFNTASTGTAQLIARYSNPDILHPRPRASNVTQQSSSIQLSNGGILTIATRASTSGQNASIAVTLGYTTSTGITDVGYIATNVPSNLSPWSDTTRVMFRGKIYLVRTLDIQTGANAIANGSSVSVVNINPNGPITLDINTVDTVNNLFTVVGDYSLYFVANSVFTIQGTHTINDRAWIVASSAYDPGTGLTSITPTDIIPNIFPLPAQIVQSGERETQTGEVIFLLGSSPFTIYDKIPNSYIDADFLTTVNSSVASSLFYNSGNIFASTTIEQPVYPPITTVLSS